MGIGGVIACVGGMGIGGVIASTGGMGTGGVTACVGGMGGVAGMAGSFAPHMKQNIALSGKLVPH
jgi:hypothetical protein